MAGQEIDHMAIKSWPVKAKRLSLFDVPQSQTGQLPRLSLESARSAKYRIEDVVAAIAVQNLG
jgi:hypothetical protein